MKILVPLKWCVDYRVRVYPNADGKSLATERLKNAINPFDEIALEQAIIMKEQQHATQVTVVGLGGSPVIEGLRYGLAMGADQALHLECDTETTSLQTATILAQLLAEHPHDLVLMGKQAIDSDQNQTGQMLASLLNWPQATFASAIEAKDGMLQVTQEVDGGLHTVACQLPCVVTADLRLNQPRYPSLPHLMRAKQKPLTTIAASTFSAPTPVEHTLMHVAQTKQERVGQVVDDVETLVTKLKQEGVL